MKITPIAAILALALCGAAQAQNGAANSAQHDADQQQRIAEGLKSGQLSIREAGRIERDLQRIEIDQARLLGSSADPRELERLAAEQQALGRDIRHEKHDAENSNPDARSAQRLADVVQRSADQQQRIARGLASGELSNREADFLERGQARVSGMQADAAEDGHVGGAEQAAILNAQRAQGQRIYASNHDRDSRDRDRRSHREF
jgi:hypothetical protein